MQFFKSRFDEDQENAPGLLTKGGGAGVHGFPRADKQDARMQPNLQRLGPRPAMPLFDCLSGSTPAADGLSALCPEVARHLQQQRQRLHMLRRAAPGPAWWERVEWEGVVWDIDFLGFRVASGSWPWPLSPPDPYQSLSTPPCSPVLQPCTADARVGRRVVEQRFAGPHAALRIALWAQAGAVDARSRTEAPALQLGCIQCRWGCGPLDTGAAAPVPLPHLLAQLPSSCPSHVHITLRPAPPGGQNAVLIAAACAVLRCLRCMPSLETLEVSFDPKRGSWLFPQLCSLQDGLKERRWRHLLLGTLVSSMEYNSALRSVVLHDARHFGHLCLHEAARHLKYLPTYTAPALRMAVLLGRHHRAGAKSLLQVLPDELVEVVLDKAVPRRAAGAQLTWVD